MTASKPSSRKTFLKILAVCMVVLGAAALFLYINFNRLLSDALMKNFNSSLVSQVYELKFKGLNVNIFEGNIRVKNVILQPREKPLKDYPYINSSFRLTTKKILLSNVEIFTLLRKNTLKLQKVEIVEPDIQLTIADVVPVFMPIREAVKDSLPAVTPKNKQNLEGFSLKEFDMTHASARVSNSAKGRDLSVSGVNISVRDLLVDKKPGMDVSSYSKISLIIGEIGGSLQKDKVKYVHLKDYVFNIDSLELNRTPDTLQYKFEDIQMGLKELDVQTADSLSHLTLQSFDLSYKDKSLTINKLKFKPNISDQEMQKRYKYQNTQFSGNVGLFKIRGLNYDSLFYRKKLLIDEISLDSVSASIYKDKTKPMNMTVFPVYLGQSVKKISMPLKIDRLNATNVNLLNTERKIDSTYAKAHICRGTVSADNISNIGTSGVLMLKATAWLEDKVRFSLNLGFDYAKPEFSIEGSLDKFDFSDLNQLIGSYTPAKINAGKVDEIKFSGHAYEKEASGTMKFLYHDLNIDLELKEKAKWKSSVLAFAANVVVASSNPPSPDLPPKIVKYHVDRDMNKSFVNITIKSVLSGLKETVLMSKENRKAYREEKKKNRQQKK
jgi:hypothetical protein